MTWPAATDALSGVKSYTVKRSLNGGGLGDARVGVTARVVQAHDVVRDTDALPAVRPRRGRQPRGAGARGPRSPRRCSRTERASRSTRGRGRRWRCRRRAAASCIARRGTVPTVEFKTTARAIAVVGRRGPLNGRAKVYVDGVYRSTIDLRRSSWTVEGRRVQRRHGPARRSTRSSWSWSAGTGRVDVDAFAFLR